MTEASNGEPEQDLLRFLFFMGIDAELPVECDPLFTFCDSAYRLRIRNVCQIFPGFNLYMHTGNGTVMSVTVLVATAWGRSWPALPHAQFLSPLSATQ